MLIKSLFATAIISVATLAGAQTKSSEQFLAEIRSPRGSGTWSILNGTVKHRRRGKSTVSTMLRLAVLFTPKRMTAQTIIDNRQGYLLTQPFKAGAEPTVVPLNEESTKNPLLGEFGIHPGDLTMSFIYWKLKKELRMDTIMMSDCRVFLLESPDKKQLVKVWINVRYHFPLKCEWFKMPVTSKSEPYRSLEVSSFGEINDIWVVTGIDLYGPGWRTKVEFPGKEAGLISKGIPKKLFKSMGGKKD